MISNTSNKNMGRGIKLLIALSINSLLFCISSLQAGDAEKKIAELTEEKKALSLKIEAAHVHKELSVIALSLEKKLNLTPKQKGYVKDSDKLKVVISLNIDDINIPMPKSSFSVHIDGSGDEKIYVGTKEVGNGYVKKKNEKIIEWSKNVYKINNTRRVAMLNKFINFNELSKNQSIQKAILEGKRVFNFELKKGNIRDFVDKNKNFIDSIDLDIEARGALSDSRISTNVDPYALYSYRGRGNGVGIYINEGYCPAESPSRPNYTKMPGTDDMNWVVHGIVDVDILRGVSPLSHIYCEPDWFNLPTYVDLIYSYVNPPIYIENHSWIVQTDSHYNTWDRDLDNHVWNFARSLFVCAGNFGLGNTNISTPAKGLNVISVGNYEDSSSGTESIYETSSFNNPETKNQKPELVAPGTNIHVPNSSGSHSGTSMASPHAAAFAADLMSEHAFLKLRPYSLKTALLAGATKNINGGTNKVGVGGLDFYRSFYNNWTTHWVGSFDYWKMNDEGTNDNYLEKKNYFSSGLNIRAAVSWLNRGDYTFSHRNHSHPIGKDFDIYVIDPNGNYKCSSISYDNPYETCNFTTTISGYYTIRINRWSNNDSDAQMQLAATFNWN